MVLFGRKKSGPLQMTMLAALVLFGAGAASAKKKQHPQPPPTLPQKINALALQLPGVMLVDADPILSQIQKLVLDHMGEWMATRTPTDVDVRRELENLFNLLHYPEVAEPATFAFPWKGQMVIGAGYMLGWTDFDKQNVLAIYTSSAGKSTPVTVTNFIPRTDLHYQALPQLAWDDLRFFVYGNSLGKSQERLSAILYSFDGKTLKPLWDKRDIYDGDMTIENDKVLIKFLKEDEYVAAVERGRHPSRYLATYHLTPAGMQFIDEKEIPF